MGTGGDDRDEALEQLSPAIVRALAETHDEFLRFLRRTLRSDLDAEDVMQQFRLRVMRRGRDVRQPQSVRGWLRRVLRSVLSDHFRQRMARQRAEADFARKDAATPPPEEDLDRIVCLCLYRLLPVLKPQYAEVLRRADLAAEPRESIARALGMTLTNVTVRLHRARRVLRRALELSCETCPIHGYFDCGCEYTRRLRAGQLAMEMEHLTRKV